MFNFKTCLVLLCAFAFGCGVAVGQDETGDPGESSINDRINEIVRSLETGEDGADEEAGNNTDGSEGATDAGQEGEEETESTDESDEQAESSEAESSNESSNETSEYEYPPTVVEEEFSRVDELETAIESLTGNLSKQQRAELKQLKIELKAAKKIEKQLSRQRNQRVEGKRPPSLEADSFLLAKIEVPANSETANVCFANVEGEINSLNQLFDYIKGTPPGAFRDFRIVSRHSTRGLAAEALVAARADYDAFKEREAQMLAYLALRNSSMSRVKNTRRC